MNPLLNRLQPYPFQRLRALLSEQTPAGDRPPINLSIGEPKHPTPEVLRQALASSLDGLASYPATLGSPALRQACANWLKRRYNITANPEREILPVNGSREALFSFIQAMIDPGTEQKPVVISPNPFYQIYEGATLLAGAEPWYVNCTAATGFKPDWDQIPAEVWARCQVVFVCSPGNPTGAVMSLDDWQALFAFVRPPWFHHRLGRMLFGNPFWPAAAGRLAGSPGTGTRFQPHCHVHQSVEALQCAGPALRIRGRRRPAAGGLPAVSHLSRQRDESLRPGCEYRRLDG